MSLPLFRKPKDALSRHDQELAAEIERLEKEIARLSSPKPGSPKPGRPVGRSVRQEPEPSPPASPASPAPSTPPAAWSTSTSAPPAPAVVRQASPAPPAGPRPGRDWSTPPAPLAGYDDHFNAQGLRKFDLAAAWRRWAGWFTTPTPANPQMIRYLASGSVQGLRPLRYERRVARNRFIGLFLLLFVILWGLLAVYFGRH